MSNGENWTGQFTFNGKRVKYTRGGEQIKVWITFDIDGQKYHKLVPLSWLENTNEASFEKAAKNAAAVNWEDWGVESE